MFILNKYNFLVKKWDCGSHYVLVHESKRMQLSLVEKEKSMLPHSAQIIYP